MQARKVKRLHPSYRDDIGDLVTRRAIPGPGLDHLDPFLFLNHHGPQVYPPDNRGLPFGPHPHRGFETVTFILEGELSHLDSGGHESIIHPGGIQWMTAGSGLVHAELSPESFKRTGGPLEILQLWINLPARLMLVELAPGGRVDLAVDPGRTIFLYIVRGQAEVAGTEAEEWSLVELEQEGDGVSLSSTDGALILFGHAAPFGEPIVSHGPFVMNSREEIVQAVQDYQAGRFGSL